VRQKHTDRHQTEKDQNTILLMVGWIMVRPVYRLIVSNTATESEIRTLFVSYLSISGFSYREISDPLNVSNSCIIRWIF
jgi:hypothetical protein